MGIYAFVLCRPTFFMIKAALLTSSLWKTHWKKLNKSIHFGSLLSAINLLFKLQYLTWFLFITPSDLISLGTILSWDISHEMLRFQFWDNGLTFQQLVPSASQSITVILWNIVDHNVVMIILSIVTIKNKVTKHIYCIRIKYICC